jgi:hypothetical protein
MKVALVRDLHWCDETYLSMNGNNMVIHYTRNKCTRGFKESALFCEAIKLSAEKYVLWTILRKGTEFGDAAGYSNKQDIRNF